MHYPIEILPSPSYKLINCDVSDFFLVRKSQAKSKDELKEEIAKKVKSKFIIPSKNIIDLSTSLLGIFKEEHFRVKLTEEGLDRYGDKWPIGSLIQPPIFNQDFIDIGNPVCWFIKIGDIPSSCPYYRDDEEIIIESKIEHDPYKWNFWHYILNWDIDSERIKNEDFNGWKADLIRFIIQVFVKQFATADHPNNVILLNTECYFDNKKEFSQL